FFFFHAEDGIRDKLVTGVQTCALPILVRFRWPAAEINFDSASSRSGLSMVKRVAPFRTSSPALAKSAMILPGKGANTSTDISRRSEERRVGKKWSYRRWQESAK